jgi:hypothetical protein
MPDIREQLALHNQLHDTFLQRCNLVGRAFAIGGLLPSFSVDVEQFEYNPETDAVEIVYVWYSCGDNEQKSISVPVAVFEAAPLFKVEDWAKYQKRREDVCKRRWAMRETRRQQRVIEERERRQLEALKAKYEGK